MSPAEARTVVLRFLRAQEFTLTVEQVSMVSAKRGSQLAGAVQPRKLPVTFKATFMPAPEGCTLGVHLADSWKSPVGKVWGMNGPYRTMIVEIQSALDAVLTPLAALVDTPFVAPLTVTSTRDIPLLSRATPA